MGKVLITGGAGYIGSHVAKKLGEAGCDTIIYDNLSTGHDWAVLAGELVKGDILHKDQLRAVFSRHRIDGVMHLAASIIVPESMENPLKYYVNNVMGTISLLEVMSEFKVNKFIFSSSAAVYGTPGKTPIAEDAELKPINPYGQGKAMIERILQDLTKAYHFNYVSLRYFNAAGADPEARIGEGKENATHLITQCLRTAAGIKPSLSVFGTDYPTPDGTCIRDYIHVEDLAAAHLMAYDYLCQGGESQVFNCGYSKGYSVLEVLNAVKAVTGIDFPVVYAPRRAGDPPELTADSRRIREVLGWQPQHADLPHIIATAWRWEQERLRRKGFPC